MVTPISGTIEKYLSQKSDRWMHFELYFECPPSHITHIAAELRALPSKVVLIKDTPKTTLEVETKLSVIPHLVSSLLFLPNQNAYLTDKKILVNSADVVKYIANVNEEINKYFKGRIYNMLIPRWMAVFTAMKLKTVEKLIGHEEYVELEPYTYRVRIIDVSPKKEINQEFDFITVR